MIRMVVEKVYTELGQGSGAKGQGEDYGATVYP
jgi:hypothetical protein